MSEYQYYEFRAVDRPLTNLETSALRAISSRAKITSTSFVNTYSYGDFRGDPDALMEKYFDAFVYVANWAMHRFMLRIPKKILSRRDCAPYCKGESLRVRTTQEHLILSFNSDEVESDWEEGEGWMDSLIALRSELLRGDLRPLYLAWLLAVQRKEVEDDEPEPRVPPGLRELSESLQSLVDFLDIDPNLIESAVAASADLEIKLPSPDLLAHWIARLPDREKDALLLELAIGRNPHLGADLLRRFESTLPKPSAGTAQLRRTAGELWKAAEALAREKARREEERKQREREVEEQRKAAQRKKHLKALAARGESVWADVARFIAMRRPNDYDRAVLLLIDLRDIAADGGQEDVFKKRYRAIVQQHVTKPSFLQKLREAGLPA